MQQPRASSSQPMATPSVQQPPANAATGLQAATLAVAGAQQPTIGATAAADDEHSIVGQDNGVAMDAIDAATKAGGFTPRGSRYRWLTVTFPPGTDDALIEYCDLLNRKLYLSGGLVPGPAAALTSPGTSTVQLPARGLVGATTSPLTLTFNSRCSAAKFKKYSILFKKQGNDAIGERTLFMPVMTVAQFRDKVNGTALGMHYGWLIWLASVYMRGNAKGK